MDGGTKFNYFEYQIVYQKVIKVRAIVNGQPLGNRLLIFCESN